MKRLVIVTLLFFLLTVTIASSQTVVKTNKATVIFYRSNMWGGAYGYKLMQGDSTLTKIKYKSFYVVELNEGTYNYWAKNSGGRDDITLNVKAGQTYLIKCGTSFSVPASKPNMILLTDEQAKKESKKGYLKHMLSEHNLKTHGRLDTEFQILFVQDNKGHSFIVTSWYAHSSKIKRNKKRRALFS